MMTVAFPAERSTVISSALMAKIAFSDSSLSIMFRYAVAVVPSVPAVTLLRRNTTCSSDSAISSSIVSISIVFMYSPGLKVNV